MVLKINRNNDFRRVYRRGESRVHALLVTYAMKNRTGDARVAVVSSKKIGGAVQRNRARRVVRAALKDAQLPALNGWDLVFVCRARTTKVKSTDVLPVLIRQVRELTGI